MDFCIERVLHHLDDDVTFKSVPAGRLDRRAVPLLPTDPKIPVWACSERPLHPIKWPIRDTRGVLCAFTVNRKVAPGPSRFATRQSPSIGTWLYFDVQSKLVHWLIVPVVAHKPPARTHGTPSGPR